MTYYADLSPYEDRCGRKLRKTRNVGWLDAAYDFERGRVSRSFVDALWELCQESVNRKRGYHICNLCEATQTAPLEMRRRGVLLSLGSAEIRAFGDDGRAYAAPDLVIHYVVDHGYKPPRDFIRAVQFGPRPHGPNYARKLRAAERREEVGIRSLWRRQNERHRKR